MKNLTSVLLLTFVLASTFIQAKDGMKRPIFHPIAERPTDAEIV